MDDDVEYLGTRLAAPEHIDVDHPVTGVALHVDMCGDKPAHNIYFYRPRSPYVNIGRKSGSDDRSMRRENDDRNVVFTCQVVSARHAKLVLSDSGQVYIVDLHSRHGTHLARCGEPAPRMLQPQVETLLADGDVLTFGKVVGAGSYHVSPVTVRVELLTGPPPCEPIADHAVVHSHPSSPVLELRPRRLSSGRYGLISACIIESDSPQSSSSLSVSSDAASSQSEQESDGEDEHNCVPTVLRDNHGKSSVKIPAFRSFIREMSSFHDPVWNLPVIDVPDEPLEDAPPSADVIIHASPVIVAEPYPKPRSPSPIDLVPSPSPSEAQQPEPAVVGAWPASRPESPHHSSFEMVTEESEASLAPKPPPREPSVPPQPPSRIEASYSRALAELTKYVSSQPLYMQAGGPFGTSSGSLIGLGPVPPLPPPPPPLPHNLPPFHPLHKVATERPSSEVKASFNKSVEDRITALQETVGDLKSRQTVTEEDVVDLQSHIETLEPESERLLCRISGAERNIATLSTLQGQMTALQSQVSTLRARLDVPEPRLAESPMDDVKACADALNSLVTEMKALREDVEKRIEAKMEAIQIVRTEALDALKEVATETETFKSSKRKRGDEEVEEETFEPFVAEVPVLQAPVLQPPLSVPDVPAIPACVSLPVHVPQVPTPVAPTRPKKRARTVMYSVVQTAAAMTIGAAATWSALAFS